MKTVLMLKVLWKRHWWEACLFVLFSLLLSGLIVAETGARFWNGLVWLEVGSLVLLVAGWA